MAKNSHLETHDQPVREKLAYQNYLNNKSETYLMVEEKEASDATIDTNEPEDKDKKKKRKGKKSKADKDDKEEPDVTDKKAQWFLSHLL